MLEFQSKCDLNRILFNTFLVCGLLWLLQILEEYKFCRDRLQSSMGTIFMEKENFQSSISISMKNENSEAMLLAPFSPHNS